MRICSLLLAASLAGCSPAAPPAAEPRVPALPEPLTVQLAAPSAPAPVIEVAPADAGPPTSPAPRVVVPDGKCSGRALGLEDVQKQCACRVSETDRAASPLCPGEPKGQGAPVPGLVVTLVLDEATVRSGGKVQGTVRFRNESDAALPLHFLRDTVVSLELLTEAGAAIPKEGEGQCVATLSVASLAGITLAPGGEVVVKALTRATKRRYRPRSCDTTAGSPLPPGRYSVGISESPLYASAHATPAPIEIVK
jgi:hypothetical protein